MAGNTPRVPEQFHPHGVDIDGDEFHVSELVSESSGAHSPFGDLEFPLPIEQLTYTHPGAKERPHLADGR